MAIAEALRARLERALNALWYPEPGARVPRLALAALAPLAALTRAVALRRRAAVRRLPAGARPQVIVIGNLVAGGTGKTPATVGAAQSLAARGWRVGLLAGGYRARREDPRLVRPDDDPAEHGDEAVLLAGQTGLPVAAGRRRGAALEVLLRTHPDLDLVLSDDGLQHPGLPRSAEVAVFDRRGAGNGRLLPAGPLREPLERAARVDALLLNDGARAPVAARRCFSFAVEPRRFRALHDERTLDCAAFARLAAGRPVAAIAGIAQPQRFFQTLRALGLEVAPHPLADHAPIDRATLSALTAELVVMTSKDAVKCRDLADDRCWVLETAARIDPAFIEWVEERLRGQPIA